MILPYVDNPDSAELFPYKHPRRFVTHIGVNGGGTKYGVIDRNGDHVLIRDVNGPLQNSGDNFVGDNGSIFGNFSHTEMRLLKLGATGGADWATGIAASLKNWPKCIADADSSKL